MLASCADLLPVVFSHKPLLNGPDAKRFDARLVKHEGLGKGAFGLVDRVSYGSVYLARKRIFPRGGFTIEDMHQEGLTMRKLDHRHVVKLVATYAPQPHELCLLIWPAAVCNLEDLLKDIESLRLGNGDRPSILDRLHALDLTDLSAIEQSFVEQCFNSTAKCPLEYLRNVIGCAARALAHCHANDVRHLDIKPRNILLKADGVYLADFGISRDVSGQEHTMTEAMPGTVQWRAPEFYSASESSMQLSDIYSLGLVFLNIATVLYNARLSEFDAVLRYDDRYARVEQLATREHRLNIHLERLVGHALVTPPFMFTYEGKETVRPRPLTSLIARMVSSSPRNRLPADKVDDKLSMLGGIHQIYHAECCKRPISWVEDKWDRKFASLASLQTENDRLRKRIDELEGKDATYELRLKSARRLHEEDVVALQTKLRAAEDRCKTLEAEKEEIKRVAAGHTRRSTVPKAKRHGSSSGQVGYELTKTKSQPTTPSARPALVPKPSSSSQRLVSPSAGLSANGTPRAAGTPTRPQASPAGGSPLMRTGSSEYRPQRVPSVTSLYNFRASGSKLPLPTTPNRTGTPIYNRDQSSTDGSMSSSIFSRHSVETAITPANKSPAPEQGEWGGQPPPVEADQTERPVTPPPRTESPGSVSYLTATSSPRTFRSDLDSEGGRPKVPSLSPMKSWAEVAKREGQRLMGRAPPSIPQ